MFLLIGGDSEIGAATAAHMRRQGLAVVQTTRRPSELDPHRVFLDLDRCGDEWEPPAGVEAACIFAAVARLAACEADWDQSYRINVTRTVATAKKLTARGIYTLFLSTNQVFDGTRARVSADARHSPLSAYGRQKATTESVFLEWMARGEPVGILRLAKVCSPHMPLIDGWRRKLADGQAIQAFGDMVMAPTPVADVSSAITHLLRDKTASVSQLTGPRDISYAEAAFVIADYVAADRGLVQEVLARENGMPTTSLPANTTLDSSLIAEHYGIRPGDAVTVIEDILRRAA